LFVLTFRGSIIKDTIIKKWKFEFMKNSILFLVISCSFLLLNKSFGQFIDNGTGLYAENVGGTSNSKEKMTLYMIQLEKKILGWRIKMQNLNNYFKI